NWAGRGMASRNLFCRFQSPNSLLETVMCLRFTKKPSRSSFDKAIFKVDNSSPVYTAVSKRCFGRMQRGPEFNSHQPHGGSQPSVMESDAFCRCV
ncbi:mCG1028421, isoform CRA_a, partial [Mus musculus]